MPKALIKFAKAVCANFL